MDRELEPVPDESVVLTAVNGISMWPRRRWVQTTNGWASREANFADHHRRRAVEAILSKEYPEEVKEAAREDAENWESVNERMDNHVRQLPVHRR